MVLTACVFGSLNQLIQATTIFFEFLSLKGLCNKKSHVYLPPRSRERGEKEKSSLHIDLRNKECKKPCQLSLS